MYNIVFVESFESLEKFISYFPDKFFLETISWAHILPVDNFVLI